MSFDQEKQFLGENYELDFIDKIIADTQKNKKIIGKEWDKVIDFFMAYPEISLVDLNGKHIESDYENLKLKKEYLLDSYQKIYNQIIKFSEEERKETELLTILYYFYNPNLIKYWEKHGVELGEKDPLGIVNTGSCVLLYAIDINWKEFIIGYKCICN